MPPPSPKLDFISLSITGRPLKNISFAQKTGAPRGKKSVHYIPTLHNEETIVFFSMVEMKNPHYKMLRTYKSTGTGILSCSIASEYVMTSERSPNCSLSQPWDCGFTSAYLIKVTKNEKKKRVSHSPSTLIAKDGKHKHISNEINNRSSTFSLIH